MGIAIISRNHPINFCVDPLISNSRNLTASVCSCFQEAVSAAVKEIFIRSDQTGKLEKISPTVKQFLESYQLTPTHLSQFADHSISLNRVKSLLYKFFKNTEDPDRICDMILRMSSFESLPEPEETPTSICESYVSAGRYEQRCSSFQCWGNRNKPKALVVSGRHFSSAWKPPLVNQDSDFYKVLYKMYDFCTLQIAYSYHLKEALETFVNKLGKIDFLALQFHGEPEMVQIGRDQITGQFWNLGIHDSFAYLKDAVQKNGTILLSCCSTGNGKETRHNFANHIANSAPSEAIVVAPVKPSFHDDIELLEDLGGKPKVMIANRDRRLSWEEMTYTIDPQNKEAHCANDPRHLNFCNP